MNGNSIIVDTNIVLYLLNGNYKLAEQLDKKNECRIIGINKNIKINTIRIKQEIKVKLPDAIIAATSQFIEIPLITSDKGFNKIKDLDLYLFKI